MVFKNPGKMKISLQKMVFKNPEKNEDFFTKWFSKYLLHNGLRLSFFSKACQNHFVERNLPFCSGGGWGPLPFGNPLPTPWNSKGDPKCRYIVHGAHGFLHGHWVTVQTRQIHLAVPAEIPTAGEVHPFVFSK